jgi:hypothetical protein
MATLAIRTAWELTGEVIVIRAAIPNGIVCKITLLKAKS